LDPPWDWGDEGDGDGCYARSRPVYATMPIEQIAALPVSALAEPNAHIYLWITNRSLPKGFALLDGWGFRYITMLTWCKPHFGMGTYFRGSTEHVLFGVRGSLPLLRSDVGTWFEAPRPGQHSAKPDAFYSLVETCSPGPWLEMFARRARPGWQVWGAEV
jgi:N6-adenosine-specific RNA methylase IME4